MRAAILGLRASGSKLYKNRGFIWTERYIGRLEAAHERTFLSIINPLIYEYHLAGWPNKPAGFYRYL